MCAELTLAETVTAWVERSLPGDEEAVQAAVALALRSYAGGASVGESCELARRLIASWSHHPSRPLGAPRLFAVA